MPENLTRPDDPGREPPRPMPAPITRSILAALRIHARRWQLVRWVVVLSAVGALTISVTAARSKADRAREQWSDTRVAWVAVHEIDAGHEIEPNDVARRELPVGALPVDSSQNPIGLRLRDAVTAGEVIRSGRLATAGSGEIAARLPPGTSGVTVPVDGGSVLTVTDFVDLVALRNGRTVAVRAMVVSTADGWATFAIENRRVRDLVNELTLGGVIAVLVP